jgi:large subunit ribosomal protein L17
MPHQAHLRTLGRVTDHRLSMLRNLAVAVLRYERVKTTEARAKEVRRFVDKIVNLGREGSLSARRRALALTRDRLIVEKTFTDLRDRFADRGSGYTRLVRLGHRVGDGAPMMLIELLEGAPAQAKPEAPAGEAEPGGVRAIARRLRRGGQPKPEQEGVAEPAETQEEEAKPKPRAKAAPKKEAKPERKKAEKKETSKKASAKKATAGDKKKPAAKKKKGD